MAKPFSVGDPVPKGMHLFTNNTGGERNGQKYFLEISSDSQGHPGTWHYYVKNGKISESFFVATPQEQAVAAPEPVAAVMPAPAPTPEPQPQPAPAQPEPQAISSTPQPTTTSAPQPVTGGAAAPSEPNWITNSDGKQYYVETGTDSKGNTGKWHIYKDGSKVFLADEENATQGGVVAGGLQAIATAPAGGVAAPSQTGNNDVAGGALAPSENSVRSRSAGSVDSASIQVTPASVTVGQAYTVTSGDTMWDIAQAHNMSLDELVALNPQVENPSLIHPGEQINLGGAAEAAASFPTTSSYDATTTAPAAAETTQDTTGWGAGEGAAAAADPAQQAITMSPNVDTDPLKINDKKS